LGVIKRMWCVFCARLASSRPRAVSLSNRVVVATPDASARRDDDDASARRDDDDAHDDDDDDDDDAAADDDARDGNARRTTRDGALGAPIGPGTTLPDDDDARERERGDPARAPVPRRTRV
jgi:hypothetical protein